MVEIAKKGGVMFPLYQREAMWMSFEATKSFAIRVFVGGVNAISGQPWNRPRTLYDQLQDYLVTPDQKHLDGIVVSKDAVRQFIAMPLGSGYSIEKQITGKEDLGGIQLEIIPAGEIPSFVDEYNRTKDIPVNRTPRQCGLRVGKCVQLYPAPLLPISEILLREYYSEDREPQWSEHKETEQRNKDQWAPGTTVRMKAIYPYTFDIEIVDESYALIAQAEAKVMPWDSGCNYPFNQIVGHPGNIRLGEHKLLWNGSEIRMLTKSFQELGFNSRESLTEVPYPRVHSTGNLRSESTPSIYTAIQSSVAGSPGHGFHKHGPGPKSQERTFPVLNPTSMQMSAMSMPTNASPGPQAPGRDKHDYHLEQPNYELEPAEARKRKSMVNESGPYGPSPRPPIAMESCHYMLPTEEPASQAQRPEPSEVGWSMGLAAGAKLRQVIARDKNLPSTWDKSRAVLVNVQIVNAVAFEAMTGMVAPPTPITPQAYIDAGFPFFTTYGEDAAKAAGEKGFEAIKSVGQLDAILGKINLGTNVAKEKNTGCTVCGLNYCDCILRPCNHAFCAYYVHRYMMSPRDFFPPLVHCRICSRVATRLLGFSAPMALPGQDKVDFSKRDVVVMPAYSGALGFQPMPELEGSPVDGVGPRAAGGNVEVEANPYHRPYSPPPPVEADGGWVKEKGGVYELATNS